MKNLFYFLAILWMIIYAICTFSAPYIMISNMHYRFDGLQVTNVTKDSLECEFYKQYLTPINKK